MKNVIT